MLLDFPLSLFQTKIKVKVKIFTFPVVKMCTPEGWLPGATIVTGAATRGDSVEMWAAPDAVTTWVIPAIKSKIIITITLLTQLLATK